MFDPVTAIACALIVSTGVRKYAEEIRKSRRIASLEDCPVVNEVLVAWTPELLDIDNKASDALVHAMDLGAFIEHGVPLPAGASHG